MQIANAEIRRFRALKSVSVDFDAVTCLLGENNSGKSAFLKAIELFFAGAPKVTERDFNGGDCGEDIEITLKFVNLTPHEQELFQANLIDSTLIVTRTLSLTRPDQHGRFSVDTYANAAFADCRNESEKSPKRDKYK
jgi:predicted ATP-dependent endonuclease of OLD family